MKLEAGQRLSSAKGDVAVIVVKAPSANVGLCCGGLPMLGPMTIVSGRQDVDSSHGSAEVRIQMGKRYGSGESGIEFLRIRSGEGPIELGGRGILEELAARELPSSD